MAEGVGFIQSRESRAGGGVGGVVFHPSLGNAEMMEAVSS